MDYESLKQEIFDRVNQELEDVQGKPAINGVEERKEGDGHTEERQKSWNEDWNSPEVNGVKSKGKGKGKKGDGKGKGKPFEGECFNCLEKGHRATKCKNETHPLAKAGKAGGKGKGFKGKGKGKGKSNLGALGEYEWDPSWSPVPWWPTLALQDATPTAAAAPQTQPAVKPQIKGANSLRRIGALTKKPITFENPKYFSRMCDEEDDKYEEDYPSAQSRAEKSSKNNAMPRIQRGNQRDRRTLAKIECESEDDIEVIAHQVEQEETMREHEGSAGRSSTTSSRRRIGRTRQRRSRRSPNDVDY